MNVEKTMNNKTQWTSERRSRKTFNIKTEKVTNVDNTPRRPSRVTARPYRMSPSDYQSYFTQLIFGHSEWIRMIALLVLDEPVTYQQAVQSADGEKWVSAIKEELDAHRKNKTFTPVKRTRDMNVIGCRWVFKVKRDAQGSVSKYKARLVAKGYNQEYGIDYHEHSHRCSSTNHFASSLFSHFTLTCE